MTDKKITDNVGLHHGAAAILPDLEPVAGSFQMPLTDSCLKEIYSHI